MLNNKSVTIIGSGFSSLAASCYLAQKGFKVSVYEKNDHAGGRARVFESDGYKFDMGPSWYWMPDVFERFFADFGKEVSDYYELIKLNPAYEVYFKDSSSITIPDSVEGIYEIFEKEEKGSSIALKKFLKEAEYNYNVAIKDLVYKPGVSPLELVTPETIKNIGQFASNIRSNIRKRFKNEKLIKILEFPVLFLGAKPQNTPSFYSFMNYADFVLGTWYPKGGMYKIVEGMQKLAEDLGVEFNFNSSISKINTSGNEVTSITIGDKDVPVDILLSGADYHHTETLLPQRNRSYSEKYWSNRTFAPSALLFYVGFNKKLENIKHHILFFDEDFDVHAKDIYDKPEWPKEPLFYASFPSVTDETVAPENCENAFFLIPLAPDLEDNDELREKYFNIIIERLEKHLGQSVKDSIVLNRSYCVNDFKDDYNAYKGNAYGMANTLRQTAFLRPKIQSPKLKNMFFTGQLTVPGPGVPPALISGKLAADLINKQSLKSGKYGIAV